MHAYKALFNVKTDARRRTCSIHYCQYGQCVCAHSMIAQRLINTTMIRIYHDIMRATCVPVRTRMLHIYTDSQVTHNMHACMMHATSIHRLMRTVLVVHLLLQPDCHCMLHTSTTYPLVSGVSSDA